MIRTATPPIDQICEVIEAHFWDWDDDRAMQAMADFDDAGRALLGRLYQHWGALNPEADYCGLVGPLGSLVDMATAYTQSGDDPEVVSRLQDALSEELHREACWRMAKLEADGWRAEGNHETAARVLREWGVEEQERSEKGGVA